MRITGWLCGLLVAAGPLAAQEGMAWVGAQGGLLLQLQDTRGAKDAFMVGVTGGTWFNNRWGMDAAFQTAKIDSSNNKGSGSVQHFQAAALFNFLPGHKEWTLYAKAGLGAARVESPWSGTRDTVNKTVFMAGVGTQRRIGENLLLGGEVRMVRYESEWHEWPVLFTAAWRFGVKAPVKPKDK